MSGCLDLENGLWAFTLRSGLSVQEQENSRKEKNMESRSDLGLIQHLGPTPNNNNVHSQNANIIVVLITINNINVIILEQKTWGFTCPKCPCVRLSLMKLIKLIYIVT